MPCPMPAGPKGLPKLFVAHHSSNKFVWARIAPEKTRSRQPCSCHCQAGTYQPLYDIVRRPRVLCQLRSWGLSWKGQVKDLLSRTLEKPIFGGFSYPGPLSVLKHQLDSQFGCHLAYLKFWEGRRWLPLLAVGCRCFSRQTRIFWRCHLGSQFRFCWAFQHRHCFLPLEGLGEIA